MWALLRLYMIQVEVAQLLQRDRATHAPVGPYTVGPYAVILWLEVYDYCDVDVLLAVAAKFLVVGLRLVPISTDR